MANTNPIYCTDGELGGNLQDVFTPDPASGYDSPNRTPGTKRITTDGGEVVYCKFLGAVNQGDTVLFDKNGNAQQITTALAAAGVGRVGTCQVVGGVPAPVVQSNGVTSYSYAWVFIEGDDLAVNVASGTAAGAALATTGTPGVLGPVGAGQTTIEGIATNVANASGAVALTSCAATRLRLVN